MPEIPNLHLREFRLHSMARRGIQAPRQAARKWLKFLTKGNIVQLSIAVVLGTAFNNIVNSIVLNVLNPIIGLMGTSNLENMYVALKGDPIDSSTGQPYATVLLANQNHVVTLNLGAVGSSIITFMLVSLLCYTIAATLLDYMKRNFAEEHREECCCCFEKIRIEAKICAYCGTQNPFHADSVKNSEVDIQKTENMPPADPTMLLIPNMKIP